MFSSKDPTLAGPWVAKSQFSAGRGKPQTKKNYPVGALVQHMLKISALVNLS
jgi:hypothetical protein